jgi:hypothetical protein
LSHGDWHDDWRGDLLGRRGKEKKLFSIGFGVDWLRDIVKEKQTKNRMESGGSLIFLGEWEGQRFDESHNLYISYL